MNYRARTLMTLYGVGVAVALSLVIANDTSTIVPAQAADTPPTYYKDVAPIIARNCLSCHVADGIAPFALDTVQDVVDYANDIKDVVQTRYMPPWMPSKESPPIVGDRSLSPTDIQTLVDWADSGAPLGDTLPQAGAPTPAPVALTLQRDLVLTTTGAYTPKAGKDEIDDYRCFVLETGLTTDRFITGYTVEAGQPSEVHHAIVYNLDKSVLEQARAKEALDPEPGYECYGGTDLKATSADENGMMGIAGALGTWTPGGLPVLYPTGMGRLLPANSFVVVQMHYNFEKGALPDQSQLVLQFAPAGTALQSVRGFSLIAPVEIPCPEANADDPACARQTTYDRNVKEDGRVFVRVRTDLLLRRCQKSVEDYLTQDASDVQSTCLATVPANATAIGVNAHMHNRGKSFRIELNPGTPTARVLLDIPVWDFHWQGSYIFEQGVAVAKGDTVKVTCAWDNTQDEQPRYILWGETTNDEMCLGSVMYVTS